jgi:hypothetical protein
MEERGGRRGGSCVPLLERREIHFAEISHIFSVPIPEAEICTIFCTVLLSNADKSILSMHFAIISGKTSKNTNASSVKLL